VKVKQAKTSGVQSKQGEGQRFQREKRKRKEEKIFHDDELTGDCRLPLPQNITHTFSDTMAINTHFRLTLQSYQSYWMCGVIIFDELPPLNQLLS
jgi:hypothetical protein